MQRELRVYCEDILSSINKINTYCNFIDKEGFESSGIIQDATVRNLEIIGEAVKRIPDVIKNKLEPLQEAVLDIIDLYK